MAMACWLPGGSLPSNSGSEKQRPFTHSCCAWSAAAKATSRASAGCTAHVSSLRMPGEQHCLHSWICFRYTFMRGTCAHMLSNKRPLCRAGPGRCRLLALKATRTLGSGVGACRGAAAVRKTH